MVKINSPEHPGVEASFPWRFAAFFATGVIRIFGRYEWRNIHKLPADGAFILTPNHVSHADVVVMGWMLLRAKRAPRFLAKDSLFRVPLLGRVLTIMGQIPVDRGARSGGASIIKAAALIKQGLAVIIYPEGTLTRDPELWPMRGRVGAARLALEHDIPVIPAAHWGVHEVLPPYGKGFRFRIPRHKVVSIVGDPVDLSPWKGRTDGAAMAEATEAIMSAITALLAELREEAVPPRRWNPAEHGQAEIGKFVPGAEDAP